MNPSVTHLLTGMVHHCLLGLINENATPTQGSVEEVGACHCIFQALHKVIHVVLSSDLTPESSITMAIHTLGFPVFGSATFPSSVWVLKLQPGIDSNIYLDPLYVHILQQIYLRHV